TAQIILEFYMDFKDVLKLNMKAATALYTGIITDTGRFKYRSVTADTFRAVAELLEFGLDFTKILQVLDVKSENQMKLQGYVLQNFEKTPNGVAYIKMTPDIIQKHQVSLEEATSLVNELSVLEDCPVWMLFAEYENNIVRARLRSKGPAIDLLANKYDGGGHKMACGANLGNWETVDKILADADQLVKEYKESLS
ncbi:MAG: bifunctional oligoribonuclease/PAP phosphatase NrnA, partial [Candidatus Izemoplasmatales bacterium]